MTVHPHCALAWHEAEQRLEKDQPAIFQARAKDPDWRKSWSQHRACQIAELEQWCLNNQPRTILELGSGWTTFKLARYACEFGATLHTVEENPDWQAKAKAMLPDFCKVEWFTSRGYLENGTVQYRELPDLKEIDLLYVDGPAGTYGGKDYPCSDAVRLVESGVLVKNVLFDMRHASVELFREVKGYGFELGGTCLSSVQWYLRPLRHHTWFWRK